MGPRIATATLILAVYTTLARARTDDAGPPANCVGGKLTPNVDEDSLSVDEAICKGTWRFGINSSGMFGLWHDDRLTRKYSLRAYKLKLHEEKDGKEAYISLYKKKGEQDPIWELKCENLSGEGETKLMIHDSLDKNNVIRLKQGSGDQDKLWLVNKDKGKDKLGSQNCKIIEHPPISGINDMIVLDENKRICLGIDYDDEMKQGNNLLLTKCDPEDSSQRFIFDSKGGIHPMANDKLCVDALDTEQGEEVFLQDCKNSFNNIWEYDQNARYGTTITPSRDEDLCATYKDDIQLGAKIVLDECAVAQTAWNFIDAADYEDPYDEEAAFQSRARQFLRKMAKVN